ncbi:MAG: Uma2 family endonuclease [Kofleriaceae bacterium]|nr:MAG: Uma2 family endonuclease [Kofleriaceae bacterium]MBZ0236323.1 Uma2 family endonuclease [Kofleriaceae bacterium]
MSRVATRTEMTADEYLRWEREQVDKHEFFHGTVFAMAGGSPRHNELCGNVLAALKAFLRPRGCSVLSSDQRVSFMARTRYVYPDVSAVCGPLELEAGDVLLNPQILVEVLSSSTEQYDRGMKWEGYQRLASLTDYVLVSQAEPRIEHFQRAADGSWTYRAAEAGGRIVLTSGAELVVDDIFAGAFALPGD